MKVLVTGASGVLGKHVMQALRDRGHDAVPAGRRSNPPVDLLQPLPELDADAVIHCAADPFGKAKAVEVTGLAKLREALPLARIVYPSIVGCDKIGFPYYKVKVQAEQTLQRLGGDHAILRLTQFHEFPERLAHLAIPVCPAGMMSQPIAAKEAAAALVTVLESDVQGHAGDVGGPEVHRMVDLIKEVLRDDGRKMPVLRVPLGYRGFRAGYTLCPDAKVGKITWAEHRGARRP